MCSFTLDFKPTEAESVLVEKANMVVDFLKEYLPKFHGYDFSSMVKFHTNYIEIPFKGFFKDKSQGYIAMFNIQIMLEKWLMGYVNHKFCWKVEGKDGFDTYLWPRYDIENDRILIPLYREYQDKVEVKGGLIPSDIKPNPEADKRYGPELEWIIEEA